MNDTVYFETIRCEDFEVFHLPYHQARMAKTVGVNFDLVEYIYPPTAQLYKCKVMYDKNGILEIEYDLYKKRPINSFALIFDDNIEYSKKELDRDEIDLLFSKRAEADEIIIIKNGLLTDTSIANIAILHDDKWLTPKLPLLEGTTRKRLLDEGKIIEANITPTMLRNASKLALMNAMIGFDIKDSIIII